MPLKTKWVSHRQFYNPEHEKERTTRYNFEKATAVAFYETEVSHHRKATATGTVVNIPPRLAWQRHHGKNDD